MDLRFDATAHTSQLYNGHTSFYGAVSVGRRRWWVQRWDVARTSPLRARFLSRDRLMGWTAGCTVSPNPKHRAPDYPHKTFWNLATGRQLPWDNPGLPWNHPRYRPDR